MIGFSVLAMGAPPGGGEGNPLVTMAPLVLVFFVFYFILIRPQAKKQKAHEQMLENLKKGDKVVTSGGIHGKISNVKEDLVVLTVGDNVKLEVSKTAVSRVVE